MTGVSNRETEQLRRTIGDLRRVTTAAGRDRLGPGLAQAAIRDAEGALAPYRLPADLVTLYEEANGWDEFDGGYAPLAWNLSFLTLDSAIETYKGWPSIDIDVWNPVGSRHSLPRAVSSSPFSWPTRRRSTPCGASTPTTSASGAHTTR